MHAASFSQDAADHLTRDGFARLAESKDAIILGVQAKRKCLGYALMRELGDEAEILSLAVSPHVHNMGLGRKLLNTCIAVAGDKKIKKIFLEVSITNKIAVALYQSCGFQICGLRKGYYRHRSGSVVDALIMILYLVN